MLFADCITGDFCAEYPIVPKRYGWPPASYPVQASAIGHRVILVDTTGYRVDI